ncbi:MAG: 30S ribosomal protein S2 [Candidatus Margulisbacteria bacterium]|nr:30S ribosomal protein S2 [Candidatus Margulisiibacteriota bacterium]
MAVITMRELLEAGVHFGHQTKRWDPHMKKYIYTSRNDIHVIDLQQTLKLTTDAYQIIKNIVAKGGKVLFVGTKKQAQEAIAEESKRCGMYYVNQRWLGGMLTNLDTIRRSVRRMKKLQKQKEDGVWEKLPTKEVTSLAKQLRKLEHYLSGVENMKKHPEAVFIVDTLREHIAVHEANILNIPIIGIVDTNCDPTKINHPIPANDDAIRAIKLLCQVIANACEDGNKIFIGKEDKDTHEENLEELETVETIAAIEKEEEILEKEKVKLEKEI